MLWFILGDKYIARLNRRRYATIWFDMRNILTKEGLDSVNEFCVNVEYASTSSRTYMKIHGKVFYKRGGWQELQSEGNLRSTVKLGPKSLVYRGRIYRRVSLIVCNLNSHQINCNLLTDTIR